MPRREEPASPGYPLMKLARWQFSWAGQISVPRRAAGSVRRSHIFMERPPDGPRRSARLGRNPGVGAQQGLELK